MGWGGPDMSQIGGPCKVCGGLIDKPQGRRCRKCYNRHYFDRRRGQNTDSTIVNGKANQPLPILGSALARAVSGDPARSGIASPGDPGRRHL